MRIQLQRRCNWKFIWKEQTLISSRVRGTHLATSISVWPEWPIWRGLVLICGESLPLVKRILTAVSLGPKRTFQLTQSSLDNGNISGRVSVRLASHSLQTLRARMSCMEFWWCLCSQQVCTGLRWLDDERQRPSRRVLTSPNVSLNKIEIPMTYFSGKCSFHAAHVVILHRASPSYHYQGTTAMMAGNLLPVLWWTKAKMLAWSRARTLSCGPQSCRNEKILHRPGGTRFYCTGRWSIWQMCFLKCQLLEPFKAYWPWAG